MELLVLLLLLLVAWVALWRWSAGRTRRPRFPGLLLLLTALVGCWVVIHSLTAAPQTTADYSIGDTALRQLLQ